MDAADHVAAKRLVADLHVTDRGVEEDVCQQREKAIAGIMPKEVSALRLAAAKARTVNDVSMTPEQRSEKFRQVLGVVLQIGILNENDRAGRGRDAVANSGALAAVLRAHDQLHVCMRGHQFG